MLEIFCSRLDKSRTKVVYEGLEKTLRRKRPPPRNLALVKGPVHIAATRAMVEYILHDPLAQELIQWSKDTLIPDELIFSTLNHHPELGVPGAYMGKWGAYIWSLGVVGKEIPLLLQCEETTDSRGFPVGYICIQRTFTNVLSNANYTFLGYLHLKNEDSGIAILLYNGQILHVQILLQAQVPKQTSLLK